LIALGIRTQVLFPALSLSTRHVDATPLLNPIPVELPAEIHRVSLWRQYAEFCRAAHTKFERIADETGSDAIVVHSDDSALFAVMQRRKRNCPPLVFWIHSLF